MMCLTICVTSQFPDIHAVFRSSPSSLSIMVGTWSGGISAKRGYLLMDAVPKVFSRQRKTPLVCFIHSFLLVINGFLVIYLSESIFLPVVSEKFRLLCVSIIIYQEHIFMHLPTRSAVARSRILDEQKCASVLVLAGNFFIPDFLDIMKMTNAQVVQMRLGGRISTRHYVG